MFVATNKDQMVLTVFKNSDCRGGYLRIFDNKVCENAFYIQHKRKRLLKINKT